MKETGKERCTSSLAKNSAEHSCKIEPKAKEFSKRQTGRRYLEGGTTTSYANNDALHILFNILGDAISNNAYMNR